MDFDLSKSFVLQGNINTPAGIKGFIFKPVLRVVNLTDAGRIEGVVRDNEGNKLPYTELTAVMDTISSTTFSDITGFFNLVGLPTGIYYLTISKEGYSTITDDVVVIAGNATKRDITLIKN